MLEVWRIESPKGEGVYVCGGAEVYEATVHRAEDGHDCYCNVTRCPGARRDGLIEAIALEWKFAFPSRKAVFDWFNSPSGIKALDAMRLHLVRYEVVEYQFGDSGRQCAFNPKSARLVGAASLLEEARAEGMAL